MKPKILRDNVDVDEQRRIEQYEQVKGQVRANVHRELREQVAEEPPDGVDGLARELKRKAVGEVSAAEALACYAPAGVRS